MRGHACMSREINSGGGFDDVACLHVERNRWWGAVADPGFGHDQG